jgi:hypothetical protein
MTIVAFLQDGQSIVSICDSGCFCDDSVTLRVESKVYSKSIPGLGKALVGGCGSFSSLQFIRFKDWPECTGEDANFALLVEKYLVVDLQPFLAKEMHRRYGKLGEARENFMDWQLLVGIPGAGIFTLYACGDVGKTYDPVRAFACIGSGEAHAKATIEVLKDTSLPSWEILQLGAQAAHCSVSSIRPPFTLNYIMA